MISVAAFVAKRAGHCLYCLTKRGVFRRFVKHVYGKPVTKAKSALAFAVAGAVSSLIYLSFFRDLLGGAALLMGVFIAPFAALSAFAAYFIVARGFWSRIGMWQLRVALFGMAVVLVAHLLMGVPMYLTMSDEDREMSIGLWLFVGTSFVTLPVGIATAFILEARQRSVGQTDHAES